MDEVMTVINAKKQIDKEPWLAVFMCRDLKITKDANLLDLAWALSQGNCHRNDARGFFEMLDKYIYAKVNG
jgi:hypothetical protein